MMSSKSLMGLAAMGAFASSIPTNPSTGVITNGHNQKLHATKTKKAQRKAKKLARRINRRK